MVSGQHQPASMSINQHQTCPRFGLRRLLQVFAGFRSRHGTRRNFHGWRLDAGNGLGCSRMFSPSSAYHPPMTLASFVGLGLERVMSLVKSGQAPPEYAWTAFRGAWKYARMAAFGGEATVEASAGRVEGGVACPAPGATPTPSASRESNTGASGASRADAIPARRRSMASSAAPEAAESAHPLERASANRTSSARQTESWPQTKERAPGGTAGRTASAGGIARGRRSNNAAAARPPARRSARVTARDGESGGRASRAKAISVPAP